MDYVNPSLEADIKDHITSRYQSRHAAIRLEICGAIFAGAAGLCSSSSLAWPMYQTQTSYAAIVCSSLSVVLLTLSALAQKRSHISTAELNLVLRSLGIKIKFADADDDIKKSLHLREEPPTLENTPLPLSIRIPNE